MLECTVVDLASLRSELFTDAKRFIRKLLMQLQISLRKVYPLEVDCPFIAAAVAATDLLALPPSGENGDPELNFMLYRLLAALEWAESDVPVSPVASVIGAVFDHIVLRRSALRTPANIWMRWAESWIVRFGVVWRRICVPIGANAHDNLASGLIGCVPTPATALSPKAWPGSHARFLRQQHQPACHKALHPLARSIFVFRHDLIPSSVLIHTLRAHAGAPFNSVTYQPTSAPLAGVLPIPCVTPSCLLAGLVAVAGVVNSADTVASASTTLAPPGLQDDWLDESVSLRDLPEVLGRGSFSTFRDSSLRSPPSRGITEAMIDNALALGGAANEFMMEAPIAKIRLARCDTRTLRPGAWLNDEVMNLYFELLTRRHKAIVALREDARSVHADARLPGPLPPKLRPVHIFSTFFWPKITANIVNGVTVAGGGYTFNNVKSWTGKPNKPLVDIFNCSVVIVPINVVHSHWFLGVIFPQQRVIATPDSLGSGDDRVFKVLFQYLKDEHLARHGTSLPHADEWCRVHIQPCPQQENFCDCGAFALANADCIVLGDLLSYTQSDIPLFRRYVLRACLAGTLTLP